MPPKKKLGRPRKLPLDSPDGLPANPPANLPEDDGKTRRGEYAGSSLDPEPTREVFFDPRGTLRVRIHRVEDFSKRLVFHGYLEPNEATEAKVQELFGGGKYRAVRIIQAEDGTHLMKGQVEFSIPGAYKPVTGELPGITQTKPVQPNAPQPVIQQVHERGMSTNEALNAAVVTQVLDLIKTSKEVKSGIDWTLILPLVSGVCTKLIEKMFDRPKDQPELQLLMGQVTTLQTELGRLRLQPGPAESGIKDAVSAIRELLEVKEMIAGGGAAANDPETAMWTLGSKLIEHLGEHKQAEDGDRMLPRPANQPKQPLQLWQRMLLQSRGQLVQAATRGLDPQSAADLALQFLDPNGVGVAVEFVQTPDMLARVYSVIPELQQFPKFTEAFFVAFRAGLLEEGAEDLANEKRSVDSHDGA